MMAWLAVCSAGRDAVARCLRLIACKISMLSHRPIIASDLISRPCWLRSADLSLRLRILGVEHVLGG
jgi:hypothetical protein